jgi:hypothetical protein
VECLERFARNRAVIEEFAARWLSSYSTDLAKLIHIATLRDVYSGIYHHPPLEDVYPSPAVHEALTYCHEEIFTKFLDSNLQHQQRELRLCLAGMEQRPPEIARRWLDVELFHSFLPSGAPPYLRNLFLSNVRTLLTMIVEEPEQVSTAL